jgi:cobaltochelatase CobS
MRQWLVAKGFNSAFVCGLAARHMLAVYNDTTDKALQELRSRQAEGESEFPQDTPQLQAAVISSQTLERPQTIETAPKGNGASPASGDAGGVLAGLVAPHLIAIVQQEVMARVEARLESVQTTRIEVLRANGDIYTCDGYHHPMFARLLRIAAARDAFGFVPGIFISGEASSGKTTGCKMLAKAMGLKWYFNGAISMPHEMLGFIDAGGTYHRTPFRDAYEHGGVYTFDEVDRSDPVALLGVNPHLANGVATFPDGQVVRHPDCVIICTANTWGLGANAEYSGATKLDAAFLSRFPVRLHWDIDTALERSICGNEQWADRVIAARQRARTAGLKVMIDTRMTVAGAALIASGLTADEAAESTYLANLKPDQRKIVEGIV